MEDKAVEKLVIRCNNCNEIVSEDDVFCGNCGTDLTISIENAKKEYNRILNARKEQERKEQLEKDMRNYAENLIIDCEGNKFKAIKEFKDKFSVDNETANTYINDAYAKINNVPEPVDNNNEEVEQEQPDAPNLNPNAIKKTIIVATSSRKKATSAIGRGLVGGLILGPVGLLAGTTAKTKDTTTFLVIYNSGKQETVTVKNNGWLFREYCKYLDK